MINRIVVISCHAHKTEKKIIFESFVLNHEFICHILYFNFNNYSNTEMEIIANT